MDESPLSQSARRSLETFRDQTAVPLAPVRAAALWHSAVAAAAPTRNQWVLKAFVLCASCAIGAVVVSRLMREPRPEVQASKMAHWQREGDSVSVKFGLVRLQPVGKLAVVTPHLQAVVQNAVALFDVTNNATVLVVESGEVAWRSSRKSGVLQKGERIRVKELPAVPTLKVAAGVPPVDRCVEGAEYDACLAREAEGSGMAAETALYALGMRAHEKGELDGAVRLFRAYGQRFPAGVFAPEASIALMVDLKQGGKSDEARAEAARFSSRFADEPRAEDVARWSEQIP